MNGEWGRYANQASMYMAFTNPFPLMPGYVDTYVRKQRKIGRNEPCPFGSGKKYKNCCMGKENE